MIRKLICILVLVSLLFIAGCGSTGGGLTSMFEDGTVSYSITPANAVLSSTVGTNPTTSDINSVSINLTNTTYANANRKSPYTVGNVVIRYTKSDNSSFVLTEPINFSAGMSSSGATAIPVTIATAAIKDALLLRGFAAGTPWDFYVNASFTVTEDYSGKSNSYQVQLGTVRFN